MVQSNVSPSVVLDIRLCSGRLAQSGRIRSASSSLLVGRAAHCTAPQDASIRKRRIKFGGNRKMKYSEGWVEFLDRRLAKRVAYTLNGTSVGGRKRHNYYRDDMWCMKRPLLSAPALRLARGSTSSACLCFQGRATVLGRSL